VGDPTAEEWARERLGAGATLDQVAHQLVELGATPAETIKALRATPGMKLERLKPVLDHAFLPRWQEVNERRRAELAAVYEEAEEHLETWGVGRANVVARGDGPYPCPCCGFLTLDERAGDGICQVCFWQDDGQDDHDADVVRGGPNYELSLSQARANFARIGAASERVQRLVRPPKPEELRRR